jgi:hypothetical protein
MPPTSPREQKGNHDQPRPNENHPPRPAGPEVAGSGLQQQDIAAELNIS